MSDLVQANARVPEAGRPVLLAVAARLRDDPGFLARLQAFMADETTGSVWADRLAAIEARVAAIEAGGASMPDSAPARPLKSEDTRTRPDAAKATGASTGTVAADWPGRAAAIVVATGEGRGRKLTSDGAGLFEEMVRAGVRNPEISRVLGMARQSVDARAKKVLAGA